MTNDATQHDTGDATPEAVSKPVKRSRKAVALTKAERDARTPEAFARALGLPNGKGVRRTLRRMGVYVSKGHTFTTQHKQAIKAGLRRTK